MEIKLLEVRDQATYMPALAIRYNPANGAELHMFWRAGYGALPGQQRKFVLFAPLSDPSLKYNPAEWRDRTRSTAHQYIHDHWDELTTGQVIDVEYILGERISPKPSENAHAQD